LRRDANTDADPGVFDITADFGEKIDVYQDIYDPTTDKVVRVDMIHKYRQPTEAQYREFRNARRQKYLQRKNLWTITESHGTLEKLYDSVVTSISGMSVNGRSCDESTKANWLSQVPLWHKIWIVDQIFSELVEKNA